MDRYRVCSTLSLFPGSVVALSEAQHAPREARLHARGEGVYEITAPVQFKAGEVLGIDGAIPKPLLGTVVQPFDAQASVLPDAPADPAAAPQATKPAREPTRKRAAA